MCYFVNQVDSEKNDSVKDSFIFLHSAASTNQELKTEGEIMHPIAFEIFGKEIHWYGICIAVGFLAATCVMLYKKKHARMTSDQIFDCAMIALFTGILGGRIFYVLQFWKQDFAGRSFWRIFRIDQGGLVFYGGFILAIVSVMIYAKYKKLSILSILDITAPAIAIGHAFGRIGCFMQGCCFGKPAPASFWGAVHYPVHTFPADRYPSLNPLEGSCALYPVQLYESISGFILCGVLLLLFKVEKRAGCIAGYYIILYALIRFLLEFLRGDHTDHFLTFTPSQTIALFVMFPLGVILWLCGYFMATSKGLTDGSIPQK